MKRRSLSLFAISGISVILALAIAEVGTRYMLFSAEERHAGAAEIFDSYSNDYTKKELNVGLAANAYLRVLLIRQSVSGCSWNDTLVIHPYLGWLHSKGERCSLPGMNNRGFSHFRDMPSERDPQFYSILILGGSVAGQFASGNWRREIWLENELNRRYRSPNGKPFRILQGAFGAWKIPTQNIVTLMYGDVVDAVVALDGYNEAIGDELDLPDVNLVQAISRESPELNNWVPLSYPRTFREIAMGHAVTKSSFLAVAVFRGLLTAAAKEIELKQAPQQEIYPRHAFTTDAAKRARNATRYEMYLASLEGEAHTLGIRFAHFLQPIPSLGKKLTDYEKMRPAFVLPEQYRLFEGMTARMHKAGHNFFSLTKVFEQHDETLYVDQIHCKYQGEDGENPGYEIMARQMATDLASAWRLQSK